MPHQMPGFEFSLLAQNVNDVEGLDRATLKN